MLGTAGFFLGRLVTLREGAASLLFVIGVYELGIPNLFLAFWALTDLSLLVERIRDGFVASRAIDGSYIAHSILLTGCLCLTTWALSCLG